MKILLTLVICQLVLQLRTVEAQSETFTLRIPAVTTCFTKYYLQISKTTSVTAFSSPMDFLGMFQDGCRTPDSIAECIAQNVTTSELPTDKYINTFLEIDDPNRLKKLFEVVCKQMSSITKQDVVTAVTCLSQNSTVNKIQGTCGHTIQALTKLNISLVPSDLLSVCRPVKNVLTCYSTAADNACDQKLSQIVRNLALELLKTNCGGERPFTMGNGSNYLSYSVVSFLMQIGMTMYIIFL